MSLSMEPNQRTKKYVVGPISGPIDHCAPGSMFGMAIDNYVQIQVYISKYLKSPL